MNQQHKCAVLVYIEQRGGRAEKVGYELLGKGRELATQLQGSLAAVVVGYQVQHLAVDVRRYGVDVVYCADDPRLDVFRSRPYATVLHHVIDQLSPEIVLLGATSIGRDLAPRLSIRLHTGLTADCTSLAIDESTHNLLMTRPALGGNLMATIICPDHRPQMSTVRPGVMIQPLPVEHPTGQIVSVNVALSPQDEDVEVLEIHHESTSRVRIEDARIVVSCGRGIGCQDNLQSLYELAHVLKGEVAGTRAVVDAGWLNKDVQVGQTGKTVRPDLYLACGISGAIQHVSGMEQSRFIIAINSNPSAPIFQVADLGIVGDVQKIVPLLVRHFQSR